MPREDLHRLQLKKFKRIFQWAYTHSKFHRRLYEKAGVTPADITTFNDIRRVPKVDKSMMRNIQGKVPFPYGDALWVPLEEVVEFRQASGTTGQPVYQSDTWQDWEWWAECWAYILWAQGYRPADRVFIPFDHAGATEIGAWSYECVEQAKLIRTAAEKLRVMGKDFPAVDRNALRILASVKMIELNLGDAA
ncbi:MAG: hypothetical protein WB818_08970 [Desulfobacterales bacterium]